MLSKDPLHIFVGPALFTEPGGRGRERKGSGKGGREGEERKKAEKEVGKIVEEGKRGR